jgi:hypothetical protein
MPDAAERPAAPAPAERPARELSPAVFSIRPAADSPQVSRLATEGKLLRAAFDAGEAATRAAFRNCDLTPVR